MSYMTSGNRLSLYIHIPFCVRKCRYCDFLSEPAGETVKKKYLAALRREMQLAASDEATAGKVVDTVFLGGGTPSILSAEEMCTLIDTVRESFVVLADAEITAECNPGTADGAKLASFRRAGINRLSIGVQSFLDEELSLLGRIHSAEEAERCIREAREAGFSNLSIDLMTALPGQTKEKLSYSLNKAVSLRPDHISAYSLIIEEGTPFYALYGEEGSLQKELPEEEKEREMAYFTRDFLTANGYAQYEISNYAREGFASRHNMGYWTGHAYLGLGLGASSYVEGTRYKNTEELAAYVDASSEDTFLKRIRKEHEIIDKETAMEEFFILGLRMTNGVEEALFTRLFGKTPMDVYGSVIQKHMRLGLLEHNCGRLYLTPKGMDVSNAVLVDFLN